MLPEQFHLYAKTTLLTQQGSRCADCGQPYPFELMDHDQICGRLTCGPCNLEKDQPNQRRNLAEALRGW